MTDQPQEAARSAGGRPSIYSPDLAAAICAELADGRSLRSVCRDESMPNKATVFRWLAENKEFCDQYARAKEEAADALVDDILEIADDGRNDWMERAGDDAGVAWVLNGEHVQRTKVRIDARKWIAAKLKPKKYGDKVQQEVSGPNGGPVQVEQGFILVPAKS